jgi:type I restriction enzyme S subunit
MMEFREVAEVVTGSTPSTIRDDFFGGEIPFVTPTELKGGIPVTKTPVTLTELGAKQVRVIPENSIMVCCIGSLGKVGIAGTRLATNQQINSLVFDEKVVNPRYGFHYCQTLKPLLTHLAPSTTVPIINKGRFQELQIPLPPLPEQKRIAAILDKADSIRRKRQEAVRLTEELLSSVFLDMFGDPVSNPKGWDTGVLGDVIFSAKDGPHVSPEYSIDGIPFLSARHVKPGRIEWNDLKHITLEEAKIHWRKCKPEIGDILYTKGGTTGVAAVFDSDKEIAVWVHIALLKLKHNKVNPYWLENMLNSKYCYDQSQRYTHGITNQDLGLKRMVNIEMYIPPLFEQNKFYAAVKRIKNLASMNASYFQESEHVFNSLLQRAFKGNL